MTGTTPATNTNAFVKWIAATYDADTLADISRHGANCGYAHLAYYSEINDIYAQFEEEIWDILYEYAELCGYTVIGLLAQHGKNIGSGNDLRSYMVWSAVEIVAHDLNATNEDSDHE